jgi:hypothetical protein
VEVFTPKKPKAAAKGGAKKMKEDDDFIASDGDSSFLYHTLIASKQLLS